jgi:hypothetical protein
MATKTSGTFSATTVRSTCMVCEQSHRILEGHRMGHKSSGRAWDALVSERHWYSTKAGPHTAGVQLDYA